MITTYDLMAQTWGGISPDLKTKPGAPTRPDRSLLQLKPHSAAGSGRNPPPVAAGICPRAGLRPYVWAGIRP